METGIPNDPVSIRKPELTSSEHFSVVGEEDGDGYGNTPDGLTLFIPQEKLSRYDIAKTVKDNYNYVLIRDMIVNDFEWMRREMIDLGLELRTLAKEVLEKYNDFDGREDSDGVLFVKTKEWESFTDNMAPISSPETLKKFEDSFWSWSNPKRTLTVGRYWLLSSRHTSLQRRYSCWERSWNRTLNRIRLTLGNNIYS